MLCRPTQTQTHTHTYIHTQTHTHTCTQHCSVCCSFYTESEGFHVRFGGENNVDIVIAYSALLYILPCIVNK